MDEEVEKDEDEEKDDEETEERGRIKKNKGKGRVEECGNDDEEEKTTWYQCRHRCVHHLGCLRHQGCQASLEMYGTVITGKRGHACQALTSLPVCPSRVPRQAAIRRQRRTEKTENWDTCLCCQHEGDKPVRRCPRRKRRAKKYDKEQLRCQCSLPPLPSSLSSKSCQHTPAFQ